MVFRDSHHHHPHRSLHRHRRTDTDDDGATINLRLRPTVWCGREEERSSNDGEGRWIGPPLPRRESPHHWRKSGSVSSNSSTAVMVELEPMAETPSDSTSSSSSQYYHHHARTVSDDSFPSSPPAGVTTTPPPIRYHYFSVEGGHGGDAHPLSPPPLAYDPKRKLIDVTGDELPEHLLFPLP